MSMLAKMRLYLGIKSPTFLCGTHFDLSYEFINGIRIVYRWVVLSGSDSSDYLKLTHLI